MVVVLAHPDDETFPLGGTLARYAAQGVAITLVCATQGEAGIPGLTRQGAAQVGCSTCATICPHEAIEFPSRGYIQHFIRQHKIVRQSKDLLRDHPEQYQGSPNNEE